VVWPLLVFLSWLYEAFLGAPPPTPPPGGSGEQKAQESTSVRVGISDAPWEHIHHCDKKQRVSASKDAILTARLEAELLSGQTVAPHGVSP
jgi:hypothetical protein